MFYKIINVLIIYLILVISCYTAEVKNYKYTFEKKMELKVMKEAFLQLIFLVMAVKLQVEEKMAE